MSGTTAPGRPGSFVTPKRCGNLPQSPELLSWFKTRTRMMSRRERGDMLVLLSTDVEVEKCTR